MKKRLDLTFSLLGIATSFLICSVQSACDLPAGNADTTYGKLFFIPYPETTLGTGSSMTMTLHLINPSTSPIDVVMLEASNPTSETITISASSVETKILNYDKSSEGNGTSTELTRLSSGLQFGVVVTMSKAMDGYTAIPVQSWGKRYTAVTYWTPGGDGFSQIVIVAEVDCQVTVTIPAQDSRTFSLLETINPASIETIVKTLDQGTAWQIQRDFDMTGTTIDSTEKVAVLCGNTGTYVGNSARVGAFMEQIPDHRAWGTQFVSYGTPDAGEPRHDLIRVYALRDDTDIYASSADHRISLHRGKYFTRHAGDDAHYIQSSQPLMVIKFTYGEDDYPTMSLVMPTAQLLKDQTVLFSKLPSASSQQLTVMTRDKYTTCYNSTSGIILERQFQIPLLDITIMHFTVPPATTTFALDCDQPTYEVAAFMTARDTNMTFQSPLAYKMAVINPVCHLSTASPGDRIDNNCNGFIDEEVCNPSEDNSGKDCATIYAGDPDVWGYRFSFLVPEHCKVNPANTTSLLVAKLIAETANIQVKTPLGLFMENHTMASDLQGMAIYLPPGLKAVGSGRFDNITLLVTSDVEISITLYDESTSSSCESNIALRLLPEDVLGKEYFAVTHCTAHECQIQVASVHEGDTEIKVRLALAPSNQNPVTYESNNYEDREEICITLPKGGSFQLQATERDLTGTQIMANKPIAVLSGGTFTQTFEEGPFVFKDGVAEQMPPVTAWGNDFFFFQSPTFTPIARCDPSTCEDWLIIVSHVDDTNVHIGNISHNLPMAGDVWTCKVMKQTARIHSDKAVLIVQITEDTFISSIPDSSMSLLTPINQYGYEDVLIYVGSPVYLMVAAIEAENETQRSIQIGSTSLDLSDEAFNMSFLNWNGEYGGHIGTNPSESFQIGGQVYYSETRRTSFHPLAFLLDPLNVPCQISQGIRGDGIDNDCDGIVDEEMCVSDSPADTDDDGMLNEDCAQEGILVNHYTTSSFSNTAFQWSCFDIDSLYWTHSIYSHTTNSDSSAALESSHSLSFETALHSFSEMANSLAANDFSTKLINSDKSFSMDSSFSLDITSPHLSGITGSVTLSSKFSLHFAPYDFPNPSSVTPSLYSGQSLTSTTYNGQPLTSTTYNGQPLTSTTYNGQPLTSTTYNGQPLTSTTYNGQPLTSTTYNGQPLTSTTYNGQALTSTTYNGQPLTSTTYNGQPLTSTTYNGQSLTSSTDSGQSLTSTTDNGQSLTSTTYSGQSLTSSTDSGQSLTSTTDNGQSLTSTTYSGQSLTSTTYNGQSLTSSTDNGQSLTSTTDNGQSLTSSTDNGQSLTSTTDSGQSLTSTTDNGQSLTSTTDNGQSLTSTTYNGQSLTSTTDNGQSLTSTTDNGQSLTSTTDNGQSLTSTTDNGQSLTSTTDNGQSLTPSLYSGQSLTPYILITQSDSGTTASSWSKLTTLYESLDESSIASSSIEPSASSTMDSTVSLPTSAVLETSTVSSQSEIVTSITESSSVSISIINTLSPTPSLPSVTSTWAMNSSSNYYNTTTSKPNTNNGGDGQLCSCNCPPNVITTSLADSELDVVLKSIQSELYVDKKKVSKSKRKYISIPDHRPSAQAVGWLGVGLVVATFVGIFLFDLPLLVREVMKLVQSFKAEEEEAE